MKYLTVILSLIISLLLNLPSAFAQRAKELPPEPMSVLSKEQRLEVENLAIRYTVRTIELAISEIKTSEQFADAFFSEFSKKDRAFIMKQYRGLPAIYRSSPTALAFVTPSAKIVLDFRDAFESVVYINGHRWLFKPNESPEKSWKYWKQIVESKAIRSRTSASTDLKSLELLWSQALAEGKVRTGLRTLSKLDELAKKAAERAAREVAEKNARDSQAQRLKAMEDELAALREKVSKIPDTPKTPVAPGFIGKLYNGAIAGSGFAIALSAVEVVKGMGTEYAKSKACQLLEMDTPECVNTRVALQSAPERLNQAPQLEGGAAEERLALAAQFFKIDKVVCREKVPDDPIKMNVTIKRPDGTETVVHAEMKWNAEGKAESGELTEIGDKPSTIAKYSFADGRLSEVCMKLTEAEIKASKQPSDPVSDSQPTRCVKESSDVPDKDDFNAHELLVWRINFENVDCGKKKAKEIEELPAPKPATESVPLAK